LDWRVIPIINENDTVAVEEIFGDNDTLASMALGLVGADLFVNLTSAAGVFDKNPDCHPDARRLAVIDDIHALDLANLCDGKTSVGSGGMHSKLLAAQRAAQLGVPTLILSGRGDFSLTRALDDPSLGTLVPPDSHAVSSKKYWLAYHDDPSGEVVVDDGAARALARANKSLLPAGVREVRGAFEPGALVRIRHLDGRTLGVGVSNYGSDEFSRILGRRSDEIETILGHPPFAVAIHRDNLLMDAAIKESAGESAGESAREPARNSG
ncbi:MAG: glutamate 5-kinase, partial [Desulfovibrionaceae bacterium]